MRLFKHKSNMFWCFPAQHIPSATISRYRCSKIGIGHSFAGFLATAECGKPAMNPALSVNGKNDSK
jgi:hypothetical protein